MRLVSLQDVLSPGETTLLGFDASNYVYPDAAKAMWDLGYRVVQRYLRLWDAKVLDHPDGQSGSDSLSKRELDELLSVGWLIGVQQFGCLSETKLPLTAAEGFKRGSIAAKNAKALNLPEGLPIFCDLEYEDDSVGRGSRVITYHNAWTDGSLSINYPSGLYLGGNLGVSSHDLYYKLKTSVYWLSAVRGQPEPAVRGAQMRQTAPETIKVGKKTFGFDADVFTADNLGTHPILACA
jgi:hypothetical protein